MPRRWTKVHLHDDQFDDALHAACCRLDRPAGDPRIVSEGTFQMLTSERRCGRCAKVYWPRSVAPA